MKNTLIILTLASLATIGCKDANDEVYPAVYPDFTNLKVGNYWIYERYNLDSNGVYTTLGIFDSTYVEKDTLINGQTYFKYMDDWYGSPAGHDATFLRDSLHYLVNSSGRIQFSSENFTDTLWQDHISFGVGSTDTICRIYCKMTDDNLPVNTPAGTFVSKNAQKVFLMYPDFDNGGPVRNLQNRYAENVGLVEETFPFFIADPSKRYTVRRLVHQGQN